MSFGVRDTTYVTTLRMFSLWIIGYGELIYLRWDWRIQSPIKLSSEISLIKLFEKQRSSNELQKLTDPRMIKREGQIFSDKFAFFVFDGHRTYQCHYIQHLGTRSFDRSVATRYNVL